MKMLRVNDVYACVQGEGRLAGTPMVIVRLQGCSVGCAFCDTKETWHKGLAQHRRGDLQSALGTGPAWAEAGVGDVAILARSVGKLHAWALVTGGEPAEQELASLFEALHAEGFSVALETSGTALGHVATGEWADDPKRGADHVCVSPKLGNPRGLPVLDAALATADEVKFVVGSADDLQRARDHRLKWELLVKPWCRWTLQPESLDPTATALCLAAAETGEWCLSLQTHKLAGAR